MMHGAFFSSATGQHRVSDYWDGQQEDDIIGVDGYNHAGCVNGVTQGIVTPGSLFGPARPTPRPRAASRCSWPSGAAR